MQIVIDIDEEDYNIVKKQVADGITNPLKIRIANGIPIPKECGNIYAEKDIKEQIENPYQCQTVLYGLELVKPIIKGENK